MKFEGWRRVPREAEAPGVMKDKRVRRIFKKYSLDPAPVIQQAAEEEPEEPRRVVSGILTKLLNKDGDTYFVKLRITDTAEATEFLQSMWKSVDPVMYPNAEQAIGEWTDRAKSVRSTFSTFDGICIRTHAWTPGNDTCALHYSVLAFLRQRGFEV